LLARGIAVEDELNAIRAEAEAAIEDAIEYAQSCTDVRAEDYLSYITAEN